MKMPRKPGALDRHWALLMNIPAYPNWRSTRELHERMRDLDHEVDIRTVQRDLDWLSNGFPLASEDRGKARYWQWMRGAQGLEVPGMSRETALVFQQANRYLRSLMPSSVLDLLQPYFERAAETLEHTNLADWSERVMHIEPGPRLAPPRISPEIRDVVYLALLEGSRFKASYTPRHETEPVEYEVNPLGIVTREGVTYLVCSLWDYDDVLQLALHRVRSAVLLDRKSTRIEGFSLDRYVHEEAAFGIPESPNPVRLKVLMDEGAAFHLTERKLSENQKVVRLPDGRFKLTATVADTSELRWWLLGFGNLAEVLGPRRLRDEFKEITSKMKDLYC